jgi:uncharacterized protein (DUF2237 family)
MSVIKNVLGTNLEPCCSEPVTGFYRDGYCSTSPEDLGVHSVCAVVSKEFLRFSKEVGNDLSTPNTAFGFPGLSPGDKWCLCASRWQDAFEAGVAPPVVLAATHADTLKYCRLEDLKALAVDKSQSK